MFEKLRLRFILIASAAISVILLAVIGILNSIQYIQTNRQIDTVLTVLTNNRGSFPSVAEVKDELGERINEDLLSQYRYFSLILDETGKPIASYTESISGLSSQEIEEYANKLASDGYGQGDFKNNEQVYAYRVSPQQNNGTLVVVVDVTTLYDSRDNLFSLSLILFLVSLGVFILLVSALSGKAIEPFVENANKQKRFITNASHELKTPLAIISANTELQEMLTGETEWSQSTKEQTQRLTDLINQLVNLARLEEQPDLVLSEVNFSEIAQDAAEDFKGPIVKDGKVLVLTIQPDIKVKAEAKSLFELVNILVDNATKYCDPGGCVEVKLSRHGNLRRRARLEVSNTYLAGKGIDYSRFFDRFYRQDSSHNSQTKGYGIGLSMAESMVKIFKGKLDVTYKGDRISFIVQL